MTRVRLYERPLSQDVKEFECESVGQWLLDHYGPVQPERPPRIFAGEPSSETEVTGDIEALLRNDAPEYVVLETPGEALTWYEIAQIVLAVVSVASTLMRPSMPSNVNRTSASPNNALGERSNQARVLQRIEDIFGTVKSIPSLMMPTYFKYKNNQKFEYGYYCISRGYIDAADVQDGDSLISDINGASAAVYWPFTSPNSGAAPVLQIGDPIIDTILTVARSNQVDGITLTPLNELTFVAGDTYQFIPDVAGDQITQNHKQPNFNALLQPTDQIVVVGSGTRDGTYTIASVGDGNIVLTTATWTGGTIIHSATITKVSVPPVTEYTDWVTLPDSTRTEVWVNLVAPQGLYKDDGGKSLCEVDYELSIEKLDGDLNPTGIVELVTGTISGSTSDEVAETVEHVTAWVGAARARMRRTSDHDYGFGGVVVDEIKWNDLYSVSPVDKTDFGNVTTIHCVTEATARSTAVKQRQLNCIASRRIPTFNGSGFSGAFDSTGRLVSGTISPSSRIVDIIAAVSVDPKIGNRDLETEVDMAQIWSVQQQLDAWNMECGQFNYTFDDDGMSFEETVQAVANAAFCTAYRQSGMIRLFFDRQQPASVALFGHRNTKPKAQTITRKFASDSDYDGVKLKYTDPDTDQTETITLPLDGSYTKAQEFEIPGIRSFTQGWFRANREYFKIRGQRITIEDSTTLDARALLPGARVDVVDKTRIKCYDGEVVGQAGLTLTLSRDVEFVSGPHSVILMRRDGSLQSIPASPGAASNQVVLAFAPTEAIVTTNGPDGIRTIFDFGPDGRRGAQAYLVTEIDLASDPQYPVVRGVNYSDSYYQMDNQPVPDKALIIN